VRNGFTGDRQFFLGLAQSWVGMMNFSWTSVPIREGGYDFLARQGSRDRPKVRRPGN
jgi:hypothetical protein